VNARSSHPSRARATITSQTPPLVEEETPFPKTYHVNGLRLNKILSWVLKAPKPRKNVLAIVSSNVLLCCAILCYTMLEDLIMEPLSANGRLRDSSLSKLFRFSCVISHVTYMYI
jgi:hypothetical protein